MKNTTPSLQNCAPTGPASSTPQESLRLLIERFNPANYTFEFRDGKPVPIGFEWPEAIARRNEQDLQQIAEHSHLTSLPYRCRERLKAAKPLSEREMLWLWPFLQDIANNPPELGSSHGEALLHIEDILCGGIALLVVLHHDWLAADPERMTWCRRRLENVLERPPSPFPFDCETASGERKWDAFAAEAGVALLARDREDALARRLVANGVASFHYSTTSQTLLAACRDRARLGVDFERMLGLAIRWAGLRTPFTLGTRPHFDARKEVWHERKRALIQDFVDQRLPGELPDIRTVNATAAAEIEAIHAAQFPEFARGRSAARRSRRRSGRSRETLHPESLRLDSQVITAAFAWLDLRSAQSPERQKWLGYVRNFLELTLGSIPRIDDPDDQKIDGLPNAFDDWAFAVVAKAVPLLNASEDPRSLWQPILDLGSPAHQWVERFFWEWFTHGLRAARSPREFVRMWTAMIEHALTSPGWDPDGCRTYGLDGMVFELLGFNSTMNTLGKDPAFAPAMIEMENVFGRAAERWFRMPKVVAGFLNFAVQPAMTGLVLPSIKWLAAAVPSFDSYDYRYGLEENLIAFLHAGWEREQRGIANDLSLQAAFLSLLGCLVARGGHAAIALRDRVVNSAAS
jgi:hypothetical protein